MRKLIEWKADGARSLAMLGTIAVGAVICNDADRKARQAQWITWLPTGLGSSIPFWKWINGKDVEARCRAAVESEILRWLTAASVIDLAERDRASAAALPLFDGRAVR